MKSTFLPHDWIVYAYIDAFEEEDEEVAIFFYLTRAERVVGCEGNGRSGFCLSTL